MELFLTVSLSLWDLGLTWYLVSWISMFQLLFAPYIAVQKMKLCCFFYSGAGHITVKQQTKNRATEYEK